MTTATEHPDLARVLGGLARRFPAPAARAGAALGRALAELEATPLPEHAWHASTLTGDGFPVELTFTSADTVLRHTVAPWPYEGTAERLDLAADLIAHLGGVAVEEPVLAALRDLQPGGSRLRFGAWVGGRHVGDDLAADRFKLYAEVRAAGTAGAPARGEANGPVMAAGPWPALDDRPVRLRIHGYEPATRTHERYFRTERALPYHVRRLLRPAGLETRATELLALLREAAGRRIDDGLPGPSLGWSITRAPGRPDVFTLYLAARSLWGGDRRIRAGIERLAGSRGWDLDAYLEASEPLVARDVHATYHGLVGFVLAGDRPVELAIGLRPPPLGLTR
jgi:hypothetical protein